MTSNCRPVWSGSEATAGMERVSDWYGLAGLCGAAGTEQLARSFACVGSGGFGLGRRHGAGGA